MRNTKSFLSALSINIAGTILLASLFTPCLPSPKKCWTAFLVMLQEGKRSSFRPPPALALPWSELCLVPILVLVTTNMWSSGRRDRCIKQVHLTQRYLVSHIQILSVANYREGVGPPWTGGYLWERTQTSSHHFGKFLATLCLEVLHLKL